jgi:hypothetical protein
VRAFRLTLAAILFSCCISQVLQGGTIAIDLAVSSWSRDGSLGAHAKIINLGSDPAVNIRLSFSCRRLQVDAAALARLDPGQEESLDIDFSAEPAKPGVYPLVIHGEYENLQGHPFSFVTVHLAATTVPMNPDSLSITSSRYSAIPGQQVITLRNDGDETIDAMVTLHAPSHLKASPMRQAVTLQAGETTPCVVMLEDLNGAPGSMYETAFTVEYEADGLWRSLLDLGRVELPVTENYPDRRLLMALPLLASFLLLMVCVGRTLRRDYSPSQLRIWEKGIFWFGALAWMTYFFAVFPPDLLLRDTTVVGGDTAAHPYMASHLAQSLFSHGQIISWADGWWGGFPMFQFYFPLPYVAIALLDCVLPFNVAFKLVTLLGVLSLPVCVWVSARWMRMSPVTAFLAAVFMLPFLFVRAHTMWGVNVYSTMAGMFANSISFSLFVLALGAVTRDVEEQRARIRTTFLLAAVLASHFFTSIALASALLALPLHACLARKPLWPVCRVLLIEGGTAVLLMAWWLIPLIVKIGYTVDYGGNWGLSRIWQDSVQGNMEYLLVLGLFGLCGMLRAAVIRHRGDWLILWLTIISAGLMIIGSRLHPVFNDIRLWPFLIFGLTMLCVIGLGHFLETPHRARPVVLCLCLLFAFIAVIIPPRATPGAAKPNEAHPWALWNYSGAQARPDWSVFQAMLDALDGTPGRLAADMHDLNDRRLGSSRVMECVPHWIDKRIVEGGILSSSPGALYAYLIQGEISSSSAGLPNEIEPATFNIRDGLKHLELFNVKHVIARSQQTQQAFLANPGWTLLMDGRGLMLFEHVEHDAHDVIIPPVQPVQVLSDDWKALSIDWFTHADFYDVPVIFSRDHAPEGLMTMTPAEFLQALEQGRDAWPAEVVDTSAQVTSEHMDDGHIRFTTTGIGLPHLVKVNYYPNWKAIRGADHVYRVSPDFMMVIPTAEEVELAYTSTPSDTAARALSEIALISVICLWWLTRRRQEGEQALKQPS